MKIYTRKGDGGTTSLVGGTRVAKDDARVEAYGTVDELTAHIGHLIDLYGQDERAELERILRCLMTASSRLAVAGECPPSLPAIEPGDIAFLETRIDAMSATLPAVAGFTLPTGHPALSAAHICRTVCRRAERAAVRARREFEVDGPVMAYLNRLSDYLYALGRYFCVKYGSKESVW